MHQRYAEFSSALSNLLIKSFGNPRMEKEEEKLANLTRIRTLFRWIVEMYLTGLSTDLTLVYTKLKDLVESDKSQGIYLPIIASFLKQYGGDFVGLKGKALKEDPPEESYYLGDVALLPEQHQEKFRSLLIAYFRSIEGLVLREHQVRRLILRL
jgi:hypothetical protein